MNPFNDLALTVLLVLAALNLVCLVALLVLVIVPRVREQRAAHPQSAAKAEWASVDLVSRD